MREKSTPLLTHDVAPNLCMITARNAAQAPDAVAVSRRAPGSQVWEDLTCKQFHDEVSALAAAFRAAGLGLGDRVAIMSRTRYEWTLTDFALWTAGLISVPIYESSSAEQVAWILQDSGACAVVVETADHRATVESATAESAPLDHVWQIDAGDLTGLLAQRADPALYADVEGAYGHDDVATIIYTSGTTGRPKGCEITHGNFLVLSVNAVQALHQIRDDPQAATLLFLPLAHVLARFIEVLAIEARIRVGHAPDVKQLLPDLASFRPTLMLAVPRVFEKIYNSLDQKAASEGKGRVFRLAARTSIAYSRSLDTGRTPLTLKAQHALFDALVYAKLRAALGGRATWAISGGAPLGERLCHFFRGAGLHILEGYGLTETTAPTNVNTPSFTTVGTVGQPLPGMAVRIADDGELQVKGVGVFARYRNNPEATSAAFTEDGWFHTGDIGELDEAGRLRITGRSKEIIVTAGGKNVAPAPLEDSLRSHPLVSQCMVVGEKRPFIGALITLDKEMIPMWADAHGRAGLTFDQALTDDFVREHLQGAVDRANAKVSRAEGIRKFVILPTDFTEESGHLTPSLKVKRNVVLKDFEQQIDEMYGGAAGEGGPTEG